ncbi:hypothetical protein NM688_g718 [Phlebia brevispora]|uniref:Uncharacterized protein n=1 Tax=Phlebia brevispora TaxID=194682 RepID=A0ACC1TDQ9_9APHY|nr:hypothetical protein NM688_g718 [Phlebia brevispora]
MYTPLGVIYVPRGRETLYASIARRKRSDLNVLEGHALRLSHLGKTFRSLPSLRADSIINFSPDCLFQEHVRRCFQKHVDTPSLTISPRKSASSGGSKKRPGDSRRSRVASSPQTPLTPSYRTPRVPYRLPKSTRTQRALIRRCYSQKTKIVAEIAEYAGCDATTVWYAVHNEANDDLSEDQAYIDGDMGDVIDFDALESPELDVKIDEMEAQEVDIKLDIAALLEEEDFIPDGHEDHEAGRVQSREQGPHDTAHNSLSFSRGSSLSSLTSLNSEDEDVGLDTSTDSDPFLRADLVGHTEVPESVKTPIADPDRGIENTISSPLASGACDDDASLSWPTQASSSSSTLNVLSGSQPRELGFAVATFLNGLERPCGHLLPFFQEMEIDSAENLNILCGMDEDMWEEVKSYLLKKGMSLLQWLIVKRGLRDRAAALRRVS